MHCHPRYQIILWPTLPVFQPPAFPQVRADLPRVCELLSAVYSSPAVRHALGGTAVAAPAAAAAPGASPSPLAPYAHLLTQPWSGARTRAAFNEFFETKAHTYWASSSVVPHNDPTLLFTNAGMNQVGCVFVDVDVGDGERSGLGGGCGEYGELSGVGAPARGRSGVMGDGVWCG